ncbi:MAG: ABC transporter ATP-binding protein [Planctomycetota bacterium]
MSGPAYRGLEEEGTATWAASMRLMRYMLPQRRLLTLTILVFAVVGVAAIGPLWAIGHLIDDGVRAKDVGVVERWIAIFVAIVLLRGVLEYLKIWLSSLLGERVILDVRTRVFAHIHRLPLRFFDNTPVGTLVTRVTSDVEALAQMFSSGVAAICNDMVMLLVLTGYLFWVNAQLALVALLALPVVVVFSLWFGQRMRTAFRDVRGRVSALNGFQQEAFTGVSTTRLFRREAYQQEQLDERNTGLREAHFGTIFNFAIFWPCVQTFSSFAQAGIVLLAGRELTNATLSIGELSVFWVGLQRFFDPIHDLSDRFNVLQAAIAAAERIFGVLDEEPEQPDAPDAQTPARLRGAVSFEDVHFSYLPDEPVLRGVSFQVKPGETVAIVGPTGAGKTSIISLLARLWDVDSGRVCVDGIDVRQHRRRQMRARMAVVLQDVFLFAGTVADNIRMGDESMSDDHVRQACETVNADGFIQKMPGGYNAEIRERGSNLSVGQKQLLAFARALAADPDILVLDEATSSIDTNTEVLIQDALKKLLENRTAIAIAHRLSTVRGADRILVMHHGRLVEQGTHRELLAQGGLYSRLNQLSQATTSGETL